MLAHGNIYFEHWDKETKNRSFKFEFWKKIRMDKKKQEERMETKEREKKRSQGGA